MRLRNKLLFSYLLLILPFSSALIWLLTEITIFSSPVSAKIQRQEQQISRLIQLAHELNSLYNLPLSSGKLSEDQSTELEELHNDFNQSWKRIKAEMDQDINDAVTLENMRSFIMKIDARWQRLSAIIQRGNANLRTEGRGGASTSVQAQQKTDLQQLRELLSGIKREFNQTGQKQNKAHDTTDKKRQLWILGGGFLLSLTILSVFIWFARRWTKPIEQLKSVVDHLAKGNYNLIPDKKFCDGIGELGAAIEQLSIRLKQNESFKGAMLSQFTHEMKSPLGSIKQATNLLEASLQNQMTPEQSRFIGIIKKNNENLQRLITNILHSASYDSARLKLVISSVNLVQLMTEVLVFISPTIKEKSINVKLNLDANDIRAEIDKEKMEEVFQNLIGNAVKFSEKETVIEVNIAQRAEDVFIEISDQGIGIPDDEIPYIFEKLYRASNSKKISVKGTGLGLYITSQIIRAHGGHIQVKSKMGQGTSFKIILPVRQKISKS